MRDICLRVRNLLSIIYNCHDVMYYSAVMRRSSSIVLLLHRQTDRGQNQIRSSSTLSQYSSQLFHFHRTTCLKKSQDAFRQRSRLSEKCAIVTILNIFNYFYCVYSCEEKSERCSSYNDNLWSKHQHHYHHSPHSLFSILSCNLRVVGLVS